MCGRLNLSDLDGLRALMAQLGLPLYPGPALGERGYNLGPGRRLPLLVRGGEGLHWQRLRWGIQGAGGRTLINARSESLERRASFCPLLAQRALLVVNGFYEWRCRHRRRQAFHAGPLGAPALAIAALWQGAPTAARFTLLTRAADAVMAPVHHRMPVCLDGAGARRWLSGSALAPAPAPAFALRRVSPWVNHIDHTGAACLAPDDDPHTPDLFDPP